MIAVSLSAKVAASLSAPAALELSSLFAIRSGVAAAARELELLRAFLRSADSRRSSDALAAAWIDQIRDAAFELEDVADEYSFLSARGFVCGCANLGAWFALSRRLQRALSGSITVITRKVANTAHFLGKEEIVGFAAHRSLLMEWLTEDVEPRRTLLAVWGMGGAGKTTLVTNVYKEVAASFYFDCVAWVSVSKNFTTEDLLRRVFKELQRDVRTGAPKDVEEMNYRSLVEALQGILSKKREDTDRECPRHLEHWASKILDKCSGLPLAIVSVGNLLALKEKSEFAWKNVHDSLVWDESTDHGIGQVSSILNLGIDDLPYHLKRCFLYCSIYPEDFFVKRKILIRMWVAEGFVEEKNHATMEDVADDYLNQLAQRSLLQVVVRNEFGRAKRFQIHDLIRELILSRSAKEGHFVFSKCTVTFESNSNFRHLIIDRCTRSDLPAPKMVSLRSLHGFKTGLDASLLSRFRLLTVLNLWYIPIAKLPSSVTNLLNLCYLGIRSTLIKELPDELGRLHKLQTLDTKWSMVQRLPGSITKLKALRHLILFRRDSADFKFMYPGKAVVLPNGMKNLTCLQTLKYIEADEKTVGSLGSLKQMRSLELFGVHEGNVIHLPSSISKMNHLLCLGIGDSIGLLSSLPRLVDLSLVDAYEEKSLTFAAGDFPVLRKLRLEDLAYLAQLEFQKGSLRGLEELMLSQCFELIKIPQGIENLMHLKNLELSDMPLKLTEKVHERQESEGKHQYAWHTTTVKVIHTRNRLLLEKKFNINLCTLQG
ncbi:unnamed protein product [Urochloa decumbens]|uniref:Uncharacterized protein n=1 Tax=Urochloa decumbens TaxID=240449 RepID=A0ABC9CUG7_9POAL